MHKVIFTKEDVQNVISIVVLKICSAKVAQKNGSAIRQDTLGAIISDTIADFWPDYRNGAKSVLNKAAGLQIRRGEFMPNDNGYGRGHTTYLVDDAIAAVPVLLGAGLRNCYATEDLRRALTSSGAPKFATSAESNVTPFVSADKAPSTSPVSSNSSGNENALQELANELYDIVQVQNDLAKRINEICRKILNEIASDKSRRAA